MSDRTVLRLGAWSATVGALIAIVANVLHPRIADYSDTIAEEMRIAQSDVWLPVHLAGFVAILLIAFGLFAVARSMKGGPGEGVARMALGSLLVSVPVALVGVAFDGYATSAVASDSGAAGVAVAHMAWAAFMAWSITFLGVTPALFGAAVIADRSYPAWLGWIAVVVGAAAALVGMYGFLDGPSAGYFLLFSITSGILTLWVLALGVMLGRRLGTTVELPEAARRVSAPG